MGTLHHSSPIALVAVVVAGSVILIQHSGFFDGGFRTEILASVKAEDTISAADWATLDQDFTVGY